MTLPNILGKEFKCINKIISKLPSRGVGDDCAIIGSGAKKLVISTDSFVENVHFSHKHFSLKEIGERCAEAAISDIAAMGAKPLYTLLSISTLKIKNIEPITAGIGLSLKRHRIVIIGGDTTAAEKTMINITVIGTSSDPVKRSGAKKGDLVFITSYTGLSDAGLYALKNNIKGFSVLKAAHKKPKAKIKEGLAVSKIATSMIDISDGLASELHHIAHASTCSIKLCCIPIHKEIEKLAKLTKKDPLSFVIYGGEDYQLLYTTNKKNKNKALGFCIGEVIEKDKTPLVSIKQGKHYIKLDPKKGYLHF